MGFDFTGRWVNASGNVLTIRATRRGRYRARFARTDGRVSWLTRLKMCLNMGLTGMPGRVEEDELVLELGRSGWGPTLDLKPQCSGPGAEDVLVPRIGPSIHDGWEDVFGIPWLEPLSPFRRAKMPAR